MSAPSSAAVPHLVAEFAVRLAMLEFFVHLEWEDSPKDLVLVTAEVPDNVSRESLCISDLPEMWRSMPPPPELAAIGDRFVQDARALLLIVPSVLAPTESNWLINPRHPDFRRVQLGLPESFEYDSRFFRRA